MEKLESICFTGSRNISIPFFHCPFADRGSQYASTEYGKALDQFGLVGSMSAPANPYQNAQAESFMKTLKIEEVYLAGCETFDDIARRLPHFIEINTNSQ